LTARTKPFTRFLSTFHPIWSLAVEPQFFVLWPLRVYFAPARVFKLSMLGIILCTPFIRWWIVDAYQNLGLEDEYAGVATYAHSPFDAFAAGALVTPWSTARDRRDRLDAGD
jgi:peptidoglycan/LPS O-acetylase OafA/YrhL